MLGGTNNYQFGSLDVPFSTVGFVGIAVALLGRNTALGTLLGALLFGSLLYGTSQGLGSGSVINPELAGNLTFIIEGLVVLFVGADVLVLYVWNTPRRLLRRRAKAAPTAELPA
jgi:simple sugar transport system permease protein